MEVSFYIWRQLRRNGWQEVESDCDDYRKFCLNITADYEYNVYAILQKYDIDFDYGITWLEVEKSTEYDDCFTCYDLDDMKYALALAEENLIRNEIFFQKDYKFVSDLGEKNNLLREKYLNMYTHKEVDI